MRPENSLSNCTRAPVTPSYRIPVAIEVLAHRLNLAIQAEALDDNVAGMLVVEEDRGAIGYNSTHALVRQRFTIAHELAHYLLHVKKNRKSQLFQNSYFLYFGGGALSDMSSIEQPVQLRSALPMTPAFPDID